MEFFGWFWRFADEAGAFWDDLMAAGEAALDLGAGLAGILIGCLLLISFAHPLAHVAWFFLLYLLGAPLWFLLAMTWH